MENGENQNQPGNQGASLDVNLEALSAPEGGYDSFIHGGPAGASGENDIPGGSGLPDNLPNLDGELTGGKTDEPNGYQDQTFDQNRDINPDPNPNPNPGENQNQNPNNSGSSEQYWMKPFEQLKAANPDWEVPQGINEENYLEVLQDVLKPQQEIHPELMKMQEAINAGVSFDKIAESFQQTNDMLKMSDRELLAENYKKHYKDWSDEKVSTTLDKLDNAGMLEIEAGKIRNEINYERSQLADTQRVQTETAYKQQVQQVNQERDKQISESLDIINKAENIYGLEFSQAEKQEFSQYFGKLVTPDATGQAPMMQMLQSNETLVKIAAMLWKGDDKVRSALTNAKESGKAAILDKLDRNPQSPQRGGNQNDPSKIDLDALSAPERMM